MAERLDTVVVGGGISGLCTAHLLAERLGPEKVLLLEASEYLGGHIRTEDVDGYLCDVGPNGFLDREPRTLEWIEALGLTDDLIQANEAAAHRFIQLKGRLVEIVGPPRFFAAPLLSPLGRLRLMREPLVATRSADAGAESVWDFAARRIGPEAADNLVSTMVLGIYGGDAKALSLEHCFPRMAEMEREFGSLFSAMMNKKRGGGGGGPAGPGGTLTTFNGGIGTLVKRAAEALGDRARTKTRVTSVERTGEGYTVHVNTAAGPLEAANVILATPAFCSAEILQDYDAGLSAALRRIDYAPIAVVCTGFKREDVSHDLNGFGYLIPPNQHKQVMGCIWTSSVFPHAVPEGRVMLRTMIGGALSPETAELDDTTLLALIDSEVHALLGVSGAPEVTRIYRHPLGIPQYALHHGEVLAEIDAAEARHPGLYLTGNAYRGIGMNDCVVAAYDLADRIAPR